MASVAPDHLQRCLPMVTDWFPTIGLLPCQVQPQPTHGPWPCPFSGKYRETQTADMIVVLEFEFWGIDQNLIPNMWQLVFTNVSV